MGKIVSDETEYVNEVVERYWSTPACCPSNASVCDFSESSDLPTIRRVKVSNDVDHRTRPPNILTAPTGIDVQSTSESVFGRGTVLDDVVYTFTCNETGIETQVHHFRRVAIPPASTILQGTFPDPDWTLKMRLKIKSSKVNMASFAAEFPTTCHEMKRLASNLIRVYRDARRGRLDKIIREWGQLGSIPAGILTYNYGIAPLMSDVINAAVALQDRSLRPLVHRYVVNVSDTISDDSDEISTKWTTKKHAVFYVRFSPNNVGGVTLGNPAEWVWEAIPFSFIVDQAFSIGDWLSSLDALSGVQSVVGTISTKREYVQSYLPHQFDAVSPAVYRYNDYRRAWSDSISIPPLPTYKPSRSLKAVVNDLSLLAVLRSRK
jgi:hypothetical protein